MTESSAAREVPSSATPIPQPVHGEGSERAFAPVIETTDLSVFYGDYEAVREVDMQFGKNMITALIGPSG